MKRSYHKRLKNMDQFKIELKENALNNAVRNFEINGTDSVGLKTFLEIIIPIIEKQLKEELKKDNTLKFEMAAAVNMARRSDDKVIYKMPHFHSGFQRLNNSTIIPETLKVMNQKMLESFATFTSGGSGWVFQSIEKLRLRVDRNIPLKGKSYINLPPAVKAKKAVINVQNKDNRCFEYAILSAMYNDEIKKDHGRPSKYK